MKNNIPRNGFYHEGTKNTKKDKKGMLKYRQLLSHIFLNLRGLRAFVVVPIVFVMLSIAAWAQPLFESVRETVDGKERYVQQATFEVTPCIPTEPALRYKLTWGFDQRTATNAAVKYNFAMREFTSYRLRTLSGLAKNERNDLERVLTDPGFFAEKKAALDAFEKELAALSEDSPKTAETLRNESLPNYQAIEYAHYCSYSRDKFPMEKAKKFADGFRNVYRHLEDGSRSDYCNWEHPLRGNENPIAILLPEIQEARDLARALQVKARVEIYEGNYDAAVQTIRVGKHLAKHVADSPILVSKLVGIAIDGLMYSTLAELIRQPDAPNLYWTLSAQPNLAITMAQAVEWEMDVLRQMLPGLAKAMDSPDELSDAEWKEIQDRAVKIISYIWGYMSPNQQFTPFVRESLYRSGGLVAYPKARQWLIDGGKTPEEVESMSTAKVIGLWSVERYKISRDGYLKLLTLPHWQRRPLLDERERKLQREYANPVVPLDMLANALFPAIGATFNAEARSVMQTDVLRIVEAIRLYAAQNDGKLPEKLDDIVAVPIPPFDPFSGKPYSYKIKDGAAVIESDAAWSGFYRFVVTIK